MAFLNRPTLEFIGAKQWLLTSPLLYSLEKPVASLPAGETLVVEEGLFTDLASIPQLFQAIIPKDGAHVPAAILHDAIYEIRALRVKTPTGISWRFCSRKDADLIFKEALLSVGETPLRAAIMYYAVRLGGHFYWNKPTLQVREERLDSLKLKP